MADGEARAPLGSRDARTARNDSRILDAARAVYFADPDAPIARVGELAGVGISALYRRYPSKDDLLRALAEDGLTRYVADLEKALASDGDAWEAYATCLASIVDGQSQALAQRVAGRFTPTPELGALARRAGELAERLFRRTVEAGALRPDLTEPDVTLLLEVVAMVELPSPDGGAALRRRYLALLLEALRAPARGHLPGPPPSHADLVARWAGPSRP